MYQFESIIGNRLIINAMQSSILNNMVSHCYIIDGEKGMGKSLLANTFAKTLQCLEGGVNPCGKCISCKSFESGNHTDIIRVEAIKTKSIGVDDIRDQINSIVGIRPYKYKYKIFIVEKGETLTIQAQNALLKTIEEPPAYGIFIIMSQNYNKFLPTILSRSIVFKLKPLRDNDIFKFLNINTDKSRDELNVYSAVSCGNIGKALEIAESEEFAILRDYIVSLVENIQKESIVDSLNRFKFFEPNKEQIIDILDIISLCYRDILLYKITNNVEYLIQKDKKNVIIEISNKLNVTNIIKKIEYINNVKITLSNNSNFQITMEVMLLKLKEK